MNYKIKITAENQAIVKRIADDNGMNPRKFFFSLFGNFYAIENNVFIGIVIGTIFKSKILTTEQFIKNFDKQLTIK